jgi:multidrug resistance efflux pump
MGSMPRPGRGGRLGWVLAAVLLVGCATGTTWLLSSHPSETPPATPAPAPSEWDVVCTGLVDVEGGVAALTLPGRVVAVPVVEGQHVDAGAALVKFDDRLAAGRLEEAEAGVAAAELAVGEARKLPQQHAARRTQQQAAADAAGHRVEAARAALARKRELRALNQLSQEEVTAAEALLAEAESGERAERARLAELDLVDPTAKLRQAEVELRVAGARRDQARQALADCVLRAPRPGTVLRINFAVGDLLGLNPQAVLTFRPDGPLVVRAEVEQEFAGRVATGRRVTIQDDANPDGPRWTGQVERLSDWITRRRSVLLEPDQINDVRTMEAVIRIDDGQPPLRIGQRVRLRIHPGK